MKFGTEWLTYLFTGVLNTGMVFVACLYIAVGFYGYLHFGDAVAGNGSVTLNLPSNEWVANSARLVISLGILFSNPLGVIHTWYQNAHKYLKFPFL